jgi:hypothetical protein
MLKECTSSESGPSHWSVGSGIIESLPGSVILDVLAAGPREKQMQKCCVVMLKLGQSLRCP